MMKQLTVASTRDFTREMERLRRSAFHDPTGEITSLDEFDEFSIHILIHTDHKLAGMLRMTRKRHAGHLW